MYVHLISVDKILWVSIEEGPFVPKSIVDGGLVKEASKDWNDEETNKAYYDLKVNNILISPLTSNLCFQFCIVKHLK